jgi:hypothetical protein
MLSMTAELCKGVIVHLKNAPAVNMFALLQSCQFVFCHAVQAGHTYSECVVTWIYFQTVSWGCAH